MISLDNIIVVDTETRCELDVRATGSHIYVQHPSMECMCVAYAPASDDMPRLWTEKQSSENIRSILSAPEIIIAAHNAEFDIPVLKKTFGIDISFDRVIDSAAIARYNGLPGKLEELGKFFGFPKGDNRAMLKLSKPRRPSKTNPNMFWYYDDKPDDFETMYEYCRQDVRVVCHALQRMAMMSDFERKVYQTTVEMNQRGLPIDIRSVDLMIDAVEDAMETMSAYTLKKHGFSLSQTARVADFLNMKSIAKAPLRDLLKDPGLSATRREVAEMRQTFAKSSTAKLKTISERTDRENKVVGTVIYGGAERTLRFSGVGIQPQNIPRGMGEKQNAAFAALNAGVFDLMYTGEELATLSNMLRGVIYYPDGLYVGDYSQIEARLLAWLAGDKKMLSAFASGSDPYRIMASSIYNKPVENITSAERFLGKQAVLGAGYGLGAKGFRSMLDITYDVQIDENTADLVVQTYRREAQPVVHFWKRLGKAIDLAADQPGSKVKVNNKVSIVFKTSSEMHIILPSGRRLRYHNMIQSRGDYGMEWSAYGRIGPQGYGQDKIYPGKICGHITQSTARDVIASAMVRLSDRPLILQVHDELVMLSDGDYDGFVRAMETHPDWLDGDFPLAVEAFETQRYRK